jgi:hypothetical protein
MILGSAEVQSGTLRRFRAERQGNKVLRLEFGQILRARDVRHALVVMQGRGQPSGHWRGLNVSAHCARSVRKLQLMGLRTQLQNGWQRSLL